MWRRKRVQPESPVREGRAGEDPQPVLAPQIIRASKKSPQGRRARPLPTSGGRGRTISLLFLVLNPSRRNKWAYRLSTKALNSKLEAGRPSSKASYIKDMAEMCDEMRENNEKLLRSMRVSYRWLMVVGSAQVGCSRAPCSSFIPWCDRSSGKNAMVSARVGPDTWSHKQATRRDARLANSCGTNTAGLSSFLATA
jgi:hypothetical protein